MTAWLMAYLRKNDRLFGKKNAEITPSRSQMTPQPLAVKIAGLGKTLPERIVTSIE